MVIKHSVNDAAQAKALVKQQGMALTQEALGQLQGKASLDVRKNHDSYERIMKRAEAAREADRTDPIKAEDLADAEFSFSLREDGATATEQRKATAPELDEDAVFVEGEQYSIRDGTRFSLRDTANMSWDCLLYTSPSPRD